MCTGSESMIMGGQALSGVSQLAYGNMQNSLAKVDAAAIRDTASQDAQKILRAGQREKSAARAATAASGARVDEFSTGIEREIDSLSEQDAAMTILTGKRRSNAVEFGGKMAKAAGVAGLADGLFSAANTGYKGWKGAKQDPLAWMRNSNRSMGD